MNDCSLLTDYNSIDGKPITVETVGSLIPGAPKNIQEKVSDWLRQNTDTVRLVTDIPKPFNFKAIKNNHENRIILQKNDKFSSMSKASLVCDLDENHIIKMGGMLHKVRSLLVSAQPDDKYRWDDLKDVDYSNVDAKKPTYQTISYAAHYCLLTKAIKEYAISTVKTVDTYLIHRPDKPYEYNDDNYVVVQKRLPHGCIPFRICTDPTKKEIVRAFNDRNLEDQANAISRAVLWDMASNILVDINTESTIYIADLEQPNNSKSQLFFYQGKNGDWKRWWDTKTGFEGMKLIYDTYGTEDQKSKWKELTEQWKQREENCKYGK